MNNKWFGEFQMHEYINTRTIPEPCLNYPHARMVRIILIAQRAQAEDDEEEEYTELNSVL